MKVIGIIESAIEESNKVKPSKHRKMAIEHLRKAIVQINIGERKRKIELARLKEENSE